MNTKSKHWVGLTAGILSLAGYASAANLGSEKYTYDASGNIIEKSIDGKVTKMSFDQTNRLIGKESPGQSKETTAYDAAGRPIVMKDVTGQPTRSMSYGYGDKVLETKSHGNNTGFYYNSEGQLVGKKTDSGVATYTWDGNVLAADGGETFTNGAHISGGVPLLNGGKDIIISDYLGNTLASGLTQFTSTAYGEGLEQGRFTGKPFVDELGGYCFRYRNYNASSANWNVADPSGFPDGSNNRKYAKNDPLGLIDPLGLRTKDLILSSDAGSSAHLNYTDKKYADNDYKWTESGTATGEFEDGPNYINSKKSNPDVTVQQTNSEESTWGAEVGISATVYDVINVTTSGGSGGSTGTQGAISSTWKHPGTEKSYDVYGAKKKVTFARTRKNTHYYSQTTAMGGTLTFGTWYALSTAQAPTSLADKIVYDGGLGFNVYEK